MNKELTKKQYEAVEAMNKALLLCKNSGLKLFGMDHDILYISKQAISYAERIYDGIGKNYNHGADSYKVLQYHKDDFRTGSLKVNDVYIDSGGW